MLALILADVFRVISKATRLDPGPPSGQTIGVMPDPVTRQWDPSPMPMPRRSLPS